MNQFAHMHVQSSIFWICWLLSFGIFETYAILRARKIVREKGDINGGTLSEFVWRLIRSHALLFLLFTAFLIWLNIHFLTGKI